MEYDIKKIGDKEYVIARYPPFTKGHLGMRRQELPKEMSQEPVHKELTDLNGKVLAIEKTEFDLLKKSDYYSINFLRLSNYNFSSGFLTVPFKLRPSKDSLKSSITTDITLGPYFGITKRIASKRRYYLTIPANLGLSYININNNNTTNIKNNDIGVVPGISWATGLIFQLEDFNIGFLLGKDYASGIGNKWIYNKELWYSFAIGYNFLKQ